MILSSYENTENLLGEVGTPLFLNYVSYCCVLVSELL